MTLPYGKKFGLTLRVLLFGICLRASSVNPALTKLVNENGFTRRRRRLHPQRG